MSVILTVGNLCFKEEMDLAFKEVTTTEAISAGIQGCIKLEPYLEDKYRGMVLEGIEKVAQNKPIKVNGVSRTFKVIATNKANEKQFIEVFKTWGIEHNQESSGDSLEEKDLGKLISKLVDDTIGVYLLNVAGSETTGEVGVWKRSIPSVGGYSYTFNIGTGRGGLVEMCWKLPTNEDKGQLFRVCPNIYISNHKDKILGQGLSAWVYDGLKSDTHHSALTCLFPAWGEILKDLAEEIHPGFYAKYVKSFQGLEGLLEDKLLKTINSLKQKNVKNDFSIGSGIQYYNSSTPSEVQVYPGFYELFDKYPFDNTLIHKLLARIVVNRDIFAAKLYAGLLPHTGSSHKSALFVAGQGSSFKSYCLESFGVALSITWMSDGTGFYNEKAENLVLHQEDSDKGGDRFTNNSALRKSAYVLWKEVSATFHPASAFVKKMQGTDTLVGEEKGQNTEGIKISFINIYDSNHPICGDWFNEEAYSRILPVGFVNPHKDTTTDGSIRYTVTDMQDPRVLEVAKRITNWRSLSDGVQRKICAGVWLLQWVMSYGRAKYLEFKGEFSEDLRDTINKNVKEFYTLNVLFGSGLPSFISPKGPRGRYHFTALILAIFSAICEEGKGGVGGRIDKDQWESFCKMFKTYASSISGGNTNGNKKIMQEMAVGLSEFTNIINTPDLCLKYLGFKIVSNPFTFEGVKITAEYAKHWERNNTADLKTVFSHIRGACQRKFNDLHDRYLSDNLLEYKCDEYECEEEHEEDEDEEEMP